MIGNVQPLEFAWFYIWAVAAGNFATELRQAVIDWRRLNDAYAAGMISKGELGSRSIQANSNIALQLVLLASSVINSLAGLFLMFTPSSGSGGTLTVAAVVVAGSLVSSGILVLIFSIGQRIRTRTLRSNLINRRRTDTEEGI